MAERTIETNGVELWTESFGSPDDPPILLIMGATAQGVMWPDGFCERLVAGDRFVLRYDHRDTGQSTCRPFMKHPYTLSDLARDAVGVLDAYGIDRAHVVGASMGGMVGQVMALEQSERMLSLTSMMSSPGNPTAGDDPDALPPPSQEILGKLAQATQRPAQSREDHIAQRLAAFRITSGSLAPFEEELVRGMLEREFDRATDWEARQNHLLAVATAPDRRAALAGAALPALVIHGTEDPVCPYAHAVATAQAIPGATLLPIEKMGHELPSAAWPQIVGAILEHTRGTP